MADSRDVVKPALVVHVLWAAGDVSNPDSAAGALGDLWAAIQSKLGFAEPIAGLDYDLRLVDPPGSGPPLVPMAAVLGACQRVRAGGLEQAVAFSYYDVLGVSVLLAPPNISRWTELADRWTDAMRSVALDAAMSVAEVYLELHVGGVGDRTALAERLRQHVPSPNHGLWTSCWAASNRRPITVWELPWQPASPPASRSSQRATVIPTHRRLLAMSPEQAERDLDAWAWTTGTAALPPLTSYLLHTAKVRAAYSKLAVGLPRLEELAAEVKAATARLHSGAIQLNDRGFGQASRRRRATLDDLRAAAADLGRLSTMTGGLLHWEGELTDLGEGVRSARANAAAATADLQPQPGGLTLVDASLADVVSHRVESEARDLRALASRAVETQHQADAAIATYLRDRHAEIALAQTALVGGLLMILAAIQAFGFRLPLPEPVQAPTIAVLGSIALALPIVLPRWQLLDLGRAGPPGRLPDIATGLVGAALGWLSASIVASASSGAATPALWSLTAAALGAVTGLTASQLISRRGRASAT